MTSKLCCTDERPFSPVLPCSRRIQLSVGEQRLLSTQASGQDSRFTSTKTEELQALRQIFANTNAEDAGVAKHNCASSICSSKTARFVSFLRRKLSRDKTKSKRDLQAEPGELKRLKQDIRQNLMSDQGPDSGGYDIDALMLENVDEIDIAELGVFRYRGRRNSRPGVQDVQWAATAPDRYGTSIFPPLANEQVHSRFLRRSMSENSLYSGPIAASLNGMRLPSFSASSTSNGWKASIMESLKITSPSISNLGVMKQDSWRKNNIAFSTDSDTSAPEQQAKLGESHRPSSNKEDEQIPVVQQPVTLVHPRHSTPDAICFNHNEALAAPGPTAPMVHLYNMRISHHLRSQSTSTSVAPTRTASPIEHKTRHSIGTSVACFPSRVHQRKMSSSGFASADVPGAWGKVVKDESSSIYSSAVPSHVASPVDSKIDLPRIEQPHHIPESKMIEGPTYTLTPEDVITPAKESAPESEAVELESKPNNPSSSTLGKTSRFKEDFKAVSSKRASRHKSLISLFQSKKKLVSYSDSMGTMDGSIDDEPQRLQRAIALSDKHNATGLMASAIKQNRDEKAALLLPGHKDQADRAGVRERSHSFSRPRTLSSASGIIDLPGPVHQIPQFDRRSRSAVPLKPEFTTPVFSESALSLPSEQRMKNRALSVALDPTALVPGPMPAFQLNDVPFDVSSEPSTITLPAPLSFVFDEVSAEEDYQDFANQNGDLGAWARYPSHTRAARTGPAGPADNVKTRDFAYYPNVTVIVESSSDEGTPADKEKKRNKTSRNRTGIPKSRSMMFAREIVKNYIKHIWAPNIEFLKHGHGHRSSISTGGKLKHPELEILPPVFAAMPIVEEGAGPANSETGDGIELQVLTPGQTSMARPASPPSRRLSTIPPDCDGAAPDDCYFNEVDTVTKARRSVSSPSLPVTPGPGSMYTQNNAQFWSRMYESCVELPRFSISADQSMSHSRQVSHSSHQSSSESHDAATAQAMPLLIDEILATTRFSTEGQKFQDATPIAAVEGHGSLIEDTLRTWSRSGSPSSQSLPARLGHAKKESVVSMQSIRESSMDLWKLLKETEEKERMKLMGWMRASVDVGSSA